MNAVEVLNESWKDLSNENGGQELHYIYKKDFPRLNQILEARIDKKLLSTKQLNTITAALADDSQVGMDKEDIMYMYLAVCDADFEDLIRSTPRKPDAEEYSVESEVDLSPDLNDSPLGFKSARAKNRRSTSYRALVTSTPTQSYKEDPIFKQSEVRKLRLEVEAKEADIEFRDQHIGQLEKDLAEARQVKKESDKVLAELSKDNVVNAEYRRTVELKSSKIELLTRSLKEQESENLSLREVNKTLTSELNELCEKLANVESLQEKIRTSNNTDQLRSENQALGSQIQGLQRDLESLQQESAQSSNENNLEVSSLKLKVITLKGEVEKLQGELVGEKHRGRDKVVATKRQLKDLQDMKMKQLKQLKHYVKQSKRDLVLPVIAGVQDQAVQWDFKYLVLAIAIVVLWMFLFQNRPREFGPEIKLGHSWYDYVKLNGASILFGDYVISRYDYNVEELIYRS